MKNLLRAAVRRLRQPSPLAYWERRAADFGARSVLNLAHPEEEQEAVTARQKGELYPHLKRLLRGDEQRALDFGCGPGRFTADLAALIGGEATGVDVVSRYLDLAPAADNVRYLRMRPGTIPLPDGYADLVWICLVLGGIQGRTLERTAAEILRVLRPGGFLFLVENTTEGTGSAVWRFRRIDDYRRLFPAVPLDALHEYEDVGERISVMAGRKL